MKRGHEVLVIDKRTIEDPRFKSLKIELGEPGCDAEIRSWLKTCDVSRPDTVICNAGVFAFMPLLEMDESEMNATWQSNVFGVWRTIKAANPRNRVIVISSEGAILARMPYTWPYVGSKKALEDFVECLRLEEPSLKFTIVRPGAMRTPMLEQLSTLKTANSKAQFMWSIAKFSSRWYTSSVAHVAERILDITEASHPPATANIGQNPVLRLISLLPEFITTAAARVLLACID